MRFLKTMMFLLCLTSTIVYADAPTPYELQKPVKCAPAKALLEYLESEYGEKLTWVGKDEASDSFIAILMNKTNTTWTIVQYTPQVACVLGTGKQASPI